MKKFKVVLTAKGEITINAEDEEEVQEEIEEMSFDDFSPSVDFKIEEIK